MTITGTIPPGMIPTIMEPPTMLHSMMKMDAISQTILMEMLPPAMTGHTPVIQHTLITPPQITDMEMEQQEPTTGHTEQTILGTPPVPEWVMAPVDLAGVIQVIQSIHTQLLQQLIMDMDLNTMMTVAILPQIPMEMPMTGNTETTIPGTPPAQVMHTIGIPPELVTPTTGIPPTIWEMEEPILPMEPPIMAMDQTMMTMVATFQPTPMEMPTTGNTEQTIHTVPEMITIGIHPMVTIIHGTPPTVLITHGIPHMEMTTHGTHPTAWVTDQEPTTMEPIIHGIHPTEWVMEQETGHILQTQLTLHIPMEPLITDTDPIMMMMVATFQLIPTEMPTIGNTEQTIHTALEMITIGTPPMVLITPGIHPTEWVMDQEPWNTVMDLNMMMMAVTLPLILMQMLTTGSTEMTTLGTHPMELIIHGIHPMETTTPGIPPTEWEMVEQDHGNIPQTHLTPPHTPPLIMDMDLTTMMMDAIFQLTLITMLMTGNTEQTIHTVLEMIIHGIPLMEMITHGIPPMVMITHGIPPMVMITLGIHPMEWVTDQEPGHTAMDLNMMTMDVILPQTPILMLTTGSMEMITPGIPLMEMITHGIHLTVMTIHGITHTEWVTEA